MFLKLKGLAFEPCEIGRVRHGRVKTWSSSAKATSAHVNQG